MATRRNGVREGGVQEGRLEELVIRVEPRGGDPYEHRCTSDSVVIGRSSQADLVIPDRYLSRRQARLYRDGESWMIEDLGARNPTLVNGQPISGPTPVKVGDSVRVSETLLRFGASPDTEEVGLPASSPDSGTLYRPASAVIERSQIFRSDTDGELALRRQTDRLRLLNDVHRILAGPISLEDLLETILGKVFAELVPEEAAIFLKNAQGGFDLAASRRQPGIGGDYLYSRSLVKEVTEKQVAAIIFDTAIDERFAAAQSIMTSGVRSLVAAPLLDPQGCPGMIVLSSRAHVRRFSEDDMELLVTLASIAALRIKNIALAEDTARRRALEKELELARQIQMALLPAELPEIPGYELHAANTPSRAVSGDLYQFQERADGAECVLFLADVSGKGMAASLLTASLEALSTGPIEVGSPPEEICAKLSRRLHARTPPERYATAFVCVLPRGGGPISYANAGHNPALIVRAGGGCERLESTGVPLGLLPIADYEGGAIELGPGDVLLLYTDGLSEAADPEGNEYGVERLEAVLESNVALPVDALAKAIEDDIDAFVRGEPYGDDRTYVLVRRATA